MDITGAIFDCDGTILDSMPMWNDVFPAWLTSHGIPNARELADRYEYMNFADECYFFHEEYGIGESPEQAFEEVRAQVRRNYHERVYPFPGARAFLEELRGAGIPLAIASSTTSDLVREALAAHDLLEFFPHILYTGDVAADKQHPDIYLAACERLGTDVASTWVFEDAPFGVRTAHDAGFPTVCLLNDHDGRDERFMRENSDVLVHGYPELSLALLHDYERTPASTGTKGDFQGVMRALIVGGSPEASSPDLVARLAREADYIVAADRGAEALKRANVAPDAFCGDDDTVGAEARSWATDSAATVIHFPAEKYATDLLLALDCACHEAIRRDQRLELTLTCVSGGRPDHLLGVFGNLVAHIDGAPRIVEDLGGAEAAFECRLLSPCGCDAWQLGARAVGKTFSAVALAPGTVASEAGLQWEVERKDFALLSDVGISNRVAAGDACVTCHEGVLACFLLEG